MQVQVSCVSGAQLSNYATFLVHPEQAALSIVLTALSTAAGVVVTPLLVLLLLGQHIPVDVQGMAASIMQIVILPVGIGMACLTQPKPRNAQYMIPKVNLTMRFTFFVTTLLPAGSAPSWHGFAYQEASGFTCVRSPELPGYSCF